MKIKFISYFIILLILTGLITCPLSGKLKAASGRIEPGEEDNQLSYVDFFTFIGLERKLYANDKHFRREIDSGGFINTFRIKGVPRSGKWPLEIRGTVDFINSNGGTVELYEDHLLTAIYNYDLTGYLMNLSLVYNFGSFHCLLGPAVYREKINLSGIDRRHSVTYWNGSGLTCGLGYEGDITGRAVDWGLNWRRMRLAMDCKPADSVSSVSTDGYYNEYLFYVDFNRFNIRTGYRRSVLYNNPVTEGRISLPQRISVFRGPFIGFSCAF